MSPRSVEYVAFAEIVHGRWVRIEVAAPSPQAAVDQIRQMKFTGRLSFARASQIQEHGKEGAE